MIATFSEHLVLAVVHYVSNFVHRKQENDLKYVLYYITCTKWRIQFLYDTVWQILYLTTTSFVQFWGTYRVNRWANLIVKTSIFCCLGNFHKPFNYVGLSVQWQIWEGVSFFLIKSPSQLKLKTKINFIAAIVLVISDP